jgi:hypothetical protein
MARESTVGACLLDSLPAEPTPPSERLAADCPPLAEQAAATPLVRRLRALEPAISEGGVAVRNAVARAEAAADGPHLRGSLGGRRDLVLVELGTAVATGWIEQRHPPHPGVRQMVVGREWPRVHDRPLAPWGELVGPIVFGGRLRELTAAPGWLDEQLAMLPPLLLQRLVKGNDPVDVAGLVDALAGEVAEAADAEPGVAAPRRRQLRKRVVAAGALLVELGLARWDRDHRGLGELVVTELGLVAWLLVTLNLDGEPALAYV